jgi:nitrate/nitrite-specific signal transduction histidine kinase
MATLAQRASVDFLEARRAERNYFLLHDQVYLQTNRDALLRVRGLLDEMRTLEPNEHAATQKIVQDVERYQQQFASAVALIEEPGSTPIQRVQEVVRAYERNLNDLLKRARHEKQAQLIEDLRGQVDSFDFEIARTVEAGDPVLRRITSDLQIASQDVLHILADLEMRGWARVEDDREGTRQLVYRAEWVLSIVSGLTLLLSVWISFVLPRQVVKPLLELRTAVDHAVSGNYEIEFEIKGEGELVNLARSIRNLISHARLTV